jgi:putative tricarboxylic transport membrane protein
MRASTSRPLSFNTEHIASALIGVAGLAILVSASNIRIPLTTNVVDPRFFPRVVGALLCVMSVLHAVTVAKGNLGEPDEGEDVDLSLPPDFRALFVVGGSFVAHALLVDRIGWVPAAVLLFAGSAFGLGARKPLRVLMVSIVLSVSVFLLFRKGLGVFLPDGPLFRWMS